MMIPNPKPPRWTPTDKRFMEMAFAEALKVKGKTLPNPPVGAVLAKRGLVVGKGGTRPAGQSHAEIVAIGKAGENAAGSTLYVTLEPCSHHGRTPPCVDAILAAGIRKVVVAIQDANPLVGGAGIRSLREAGVEVLVGLLEEEAEAFYEGFFFRITRGRPFLILKIAQSLDGGVNAKPGEETAITGEAAREWAHGLRVRADAVLVGGETLRSDDPDLTPRLAKGPAPEAVVLSRGGPFPPDALLFGPQRESATWVVGGTGAGLPAGVNHHALAASGDAAATLDGLLEFFLKRGYHSVLIEGGLEIWSLFLNAGLWDCLYVVTAPKFFPEGAKWHALLEKDWNAQVRYRQSIPLGADMVAEFRREPETGG